MKNLERKLILGGAVILTLGTAIITYSLGKRNGITENWLVITKAIGSEAANQVMDYVKALPSRIFI